MECSSAVECVAFGISEKYNEYSKDKSKTYEKTEFTWVNECFE
jgi:hypothetical protein